MGGGGGGGVEEVGGCIWLLVVLVAVLACCCNDDKDDANAVLCVQSVSILMADGVCSTGEGASCEKGELVNTCEKGVLWKTPDYDSNKRNVGLTP